MRYGFGTPHETALWFINGDFYSIGGHRENDDGQVTIYAHNAPLAIDFDSNIYTPAVSDRWMHNAIVFGSEMNGYTWNQDNIPLSGGAGNSLLGNANATNVHQFGTSTNSIATYTSGTGTIWTRNVRLMAPNTIYPIIYVKDSFSGGSEAGSTKTLTWNMMATGGVSTPAGSITPTVRQNDPAGCSNNGTPNAYPSNGTVNALSNGLQQFSFSGQNWVAHPNRGIDWNLYERPTSGRAQFLVGNWGHSCHPTPEMAEYQATNGTGFRENQHILRINDTGPFETVITPVTKGTTQPTVTYSNGLYRATFGSSETMIWNDSLMTYTDGTKQTFATYDSSTQTAFGMTLSGGASEVVNSGSGTITWTISDVSPGTRCLTLAGTWYPSVPMVQSGGAWCYYPQAPNLQPSPVTITLTQTPTMLRSITINLHPPRALNAAVARIKFGSTSNYAALSQCSLGLCTVTFQAPVGMHPVAWDYLDSNGNVLESGTQPDYAVQ